MLSLIICTYNREKYIYNTLKCIAENNFENEKYEIVLVNNNSADQTENESIRFQKDYPEIPYHYFIEMNQGLSYARNRGIKEAQGNILVFLDDDSFIAPDYLKNLEKNMVQYPDLAAFGGEISPLFESGSAPQWLSKWTLSWVSAINLGNKIIPFKGTQYPIGANMGITKTWIDKVGNFNCALGRSKKNLMAGEEKDLFNRIKKEKGKIYYFPDVKVQHVIPEYRTTKDYIKRMGQGVGMSERVRTLDISKTTYLKRLLSEKIKWIASFVLFFGYTIQLQPNKGSILLFFRWNVTKGLLKN
jgi:glycosyltransferase involved in cell wall biosynthesis